MSSTKNKKEKDFRAAVRAHYRAHGRHDLPWRRTHDPYRILVSEMMLQQTQVKRVIGFYARFTKRFPTVQKLAHAPLSDVLRAWQGLGYNRRAKYLHEAAKEVVLRHGGVMPRSHAGLVALPGIGPYTASAVRAFAWDEPGIFIETNIRAAYLHHFFPRSDKVPDARLIPLIASTLDRKRPREWYSALMDYGSFLKQTEGNASLRSAHHVRQKPFKGSDREIRGATLRMLAGKPYTQEALFRALPFPAARIEAQLAVLVKEGMLIVRKGRISLPD